MSDPVTVEDRLPYQGEVFILFRNHTYQWVSIKLFALPPDADDYTVLQLLIGHVRYRHDYCTRSDEDMKTVHGPYWLYAITPEVFSPASAIDAEGLVRSFAEYYDLLLDGPREQMETEVYPRIRNATSRYQLPDLRQAAEHPWGGSVGTYDGFHEFVLIDRDAGSVALLVAADD
jgi:hypothetical protein